MTSDGTCRLVMPRSESTIARRGPAASPASTAALMASASGSVAGGGQQRAEAVVGADVGGGEDVAELLEQRREERPHDVAEDDRVGDLHHRRLEVDGEQDVLGLGPGDLGVEELAQRGDVHARWRRRPRRPARAPTRAARSSCRRRRRARCAGVAGRLDDDRLLVGAEVVGGHVGDVGLRVRAPRAHRVRVLAGVLLDRVRRPAVGVALAQHRVDGRSLHLVVAGAHLALLVGRRVVRVVGDVVALRLQLGDRRLQLGDRRRDVRQLDDVGLGPRGQLAELGRGRRRCAGRRAGARGTAPGCARRGRCRATRPARRRPRRRPG